jgi:hypothetical protein
LGVVQRCYRAGVRIDAATIKRTELTVWTTRKVRDQDMSV